MTATDELCRLLDERGVKHEGGERSLRWRDRYGIMMQAFPLANGELGMGVWSCTPEQAIAATLGDADLAAENAHLREQMERLVTLLRNDCDIDASWDGLRRFWSIGLTEGGCLMRDRACKAEAENAKLRELVRDVSRAAHMLCEAWEGSCSKEADGMSLHAVCPISDTNELCVFGKLYERMRELGVES